MNDISRKFLRRVRAKKIDENLLSNHMRNMIDHIELSVVEEFYARCPHSGWSFDLLFIHPHVSLARALELMRVVVHAPGGLDTDIALLGASQCGVLMNEPEGRALVCASEFRGESTAKFVLKTLLEKAETAEEEARAAGKLAAWDFPKAWAAAERLLETAEPEILAALLESPSREFRLALLTRSRETAPRVTQPITR